MRLPDWSERLARLVDARRGAPFAWGTFDCATFAADAVLAVTGRDPLATMRGHWTTAIGAGRCLRAHGGLGEALSGLFGPPMASPRLAGAGDLVLTTNDGLAVVHGSTALMPASEGLAHVSMGSWVAAWRVN